MRDPQTGKFLKGSQLGRRTQFKSGHKPWNTGKKGLLGSNSTSFKPGHKPHNWKPPGTIVRKKIGNWEADYIKTKSGTWERYWPNGKPAATPKPKKKEVKNLTSKKKLEVKSTPKEIKKPEPIIEDPKPIVKTKEDLKREEQIKAQKDFLAQFGITDSVISIPVKRRGDS